MKLAIFYHCLLFLDTPDNLRENAVNIVADQMYQLRGSGLLDAADELHVGINGGAESLEVSRLVIPAKARIVLHGLQCHSENRTILMLEQWLPGHEDWFVLYFHAKNASHPTDNGNGAPWRRCMMVHCVWNWRRCVADLENYEAVGCHWFVPPQTPPAQFIFAGNFWFARASFLRTLPSIMDRARIKSLSGIDSLDSRFEAEVWLGNGPRLPRVMDYHPGWKLYFPH